VTDCPSRFLIIIAAIRVYGNADRATGGGILPVPQFLQTIENNALSMWIRDTPSFFGYWFILSVHAIGMALLVGASLLIALRLLGVARDLPIAPLKRLYPVLWAGFWIQLVSGTLLVWAYPTKSLTNPNLYVKLALIAVAVVVMQMIKKRVFTDASMTEADMMARGKALAVASLVLWFAAVLAGRLLAYTYTHISYPG
jgi:hypothetical protein